MDFYGQTISKSSSEPYDLVRTLRMAGYGMLQGPSPHFLVRLDVKTLPKEGVFFSLNARLQVQGESGEETVARLKRDLLPTMLNGFMYWPFCDFITFRFIPVHLQTLMSNSFSYLWTVDVHGKSRETNRNYQLIDLLLSIPLCSRSDFLQQTEDPIKTMHSLESGPDIIVQACLKQNSQG
ncbi:hypothetical protein CRYUN_Cryun06bG0057900 [Craigia yunnanensis]